MTVHGSISGGIHSVPHGSANCTLKTIGVRSEVFPGDYESTARCVVIDFERFDFQMQKLSGGEFCNGIKKLM